MLNLFADYIADANLPVWVYASPDAPTPQQPTDEFTQPTPFTQGGMAPIALRSWRSFQVKDAALYRSESFTFKNVGEHLLIVRCVYAMASWKGLPYAPLAVWVPEQGLRLDPLFGSLQRSMQVFQYPGENSELFAEFSTRTFFSPRRSRRGKRRSRN